MVSRRSSPFWLSLIIALYLLLGAAMSLVVPLGEAPDELDHFLYARYLDQERAIPPLSALASENLTMEANQPPLYYALLAAIMSGIDMSMPLEPAQNSCFSFDPADGGRQTFYIHSAAEAWPFQSTGLAFHIGRITSLLLGALAVGLTYTLMLRIVPGEPRAALLAAALLAFNPQFIFITASVNNDVLSAVLGVAIVLASVAGWSRPRTMTFALLGLLVGLALLTKAGLFALWPVALLAAAAPVVRLFFAPRETRRAWGPALRTGLLPLILVTGLPLLISGWWYVRATLLYGDPLAWRVHLAAKGAFVLREGALGLRDLVEFVSLHFRSYWALFGWLNVQVSDWVYAGLALLVGTAVLGLLWYVTLCARRRSAAISAEPDPCFTDSATLVLTILAILATYLSLLRYIQTINWSGYQGRLAYAAAGPTAAVLAVGLFFLARRAASAVPKGHLLAAFLLAAGPFFLFFLSAAAVRVWLPAAYPQPGIFQPAGLQPTCARFANGLLLDGYTAENRVEAGQTLNMTLTGYGMAGQPGSGNLAAVLRGDQGEILGEGQAAVSWSPDQALLVNIDIPVSALAQPGRATLAAGLRGESDTWQPAESATGRDLEVPLALQTVKIPQKETGNTALKVPIEAELGGQLRLLGYDLVNDEQQVTVTLAWQALETMEEDLVTFVHLLDAEGRLLAQADSQPQDGTYPTSIWDPGEVVFDMKTFTMPQGVREPLSLAAGVYHWPGGERLKVAGSTTDTISLGPLAPPGKLEAE